LKKVQIIIFVWRKMADAKKFYDCISFFSLRAPNNAKKMKWNRNRKFLLCLEVFTLFLSISFISLMKCFGKLKFNCNAFYVQLERMGS
jgi:hypothetical protein